MPKPAEKVLEGVPRCRAQPKARRAAAGFESCPDVPSTAEGPQSCRRVRKLPKRAVGAVAAESCRKLPRENDQLFMAQGPGGGSSGPLVGGRLSPGDITDGVFADGFIAGIGFQGQGPPNPASAGGPAVVVTVRVVVVV